MSLLVYGGETELLGLRRSQRRRAQNSLGISLVHFCGRQVSEQRPALKRIGEFDRPAAIHLALDRDHAIGRSNGSVLLSFTQ
jgi:hypothetical protein